MHQLLSLSRTLKRIGYFFVCWGDARVRVWCLAVCDDVARLILTARAFADSYSFSRRLVSLLASLDSFTNAKKLLLILDCASARKMWGQPAPPPMPPQPDLQYIFSSVDRDRSGSISTLELQQALSNGTQHPFNPETCRLMLGALFSSNTIFIALNFRHV